EERAAAASEPAATAWERPGAAEATGAAEPPAQRAGAGAVRRARAERRQRDRDHNLIAGLQTADDLCAGVAPYPDHDLLRDGLAALQQVDRGQRAAAADRRVRHRHAGRLTRD